MNQIFKAVLLMIAFSYAFTGRIAAQEMNQGLSFLNLKLDLMMMNADTDAIVYPANPAKENDELSKAKSDLKATKEYFKTVRASSRASENFSKQFSKIKGPEWQVQKNAIVATFTEDEIRTYVVYDKKGHWVRNMAYLFPNKVENALMRKLNFGFPDYKINMVLRVTENSGTFDIAYLENDHFIRHICVYGDQTDDTYFIRKVK